MNRMIVQRKALRDLNRQRAKLGAGPLRKLPKGVRGDSVNCVMANGFSDISRISSVHTGAIRVTDSDDGLTQHTFKPTLAQKWLIVWFDAGLMPNLDGDPKAQLVYGEPRHARRIAQHAVTSVRMQVKDRVGKARVSRDERRREDREFALASIKADSEASNYYVELRAREAEAMAEVRKLELEIAREQTALAMAEGLNDTEIPESETLST